MGEKISENDEKELKAALLEVANYFESTVERYFEQQVQNRKTSKPHSLGNAIHNLKDSSCMELTKLQLNNFPDFTLNQLSLNVDALCLEVSISLGNLQLQSDFEINNILLPKSNKGKLSVKLCDVHAKGRTGLAHTGDSFVPKNYDFTYKTESIVVEIVEIDGDNATETKATIDETIVTSFWDKLTVALTHMLYLCLSESVVEISVSELLADEDKIVNLLRKYSNFKTIQANKLIESFLMNMCSIIPKTKHRETPFEMAFWTDESERERCTFKTCSSSFEDFSTLSRHSDMSVFETDEELIVFGMLTMKQLTQVYEKYECVLPESSVEGKISVEMPMNKIFLRLIITKNNLEHVKIESCRVNTIRDIDIDITNFEPLDWLSSKMEFWLQENFWTTWQNVLNEVMN